jgi:hypothetical protein
MQFPSINALLKHIGLPAYNEVKYTDVSTSSKKFSIMIPVSDIYQDGDKFFKQRGNIYEIQDLQYFSESSKKYKAIDHYSLKKFFYKTADLGFTITPNMPGRKLVYSFSFKVRLEDSKVGGSINYADIGLQSDDDLRTFLKTFDKLNASSFPLIAKFVADKFYDIYSDKIREAIAREIIEETTPNGRISSTIDEVNSTIDYVDNTRSTEDNNCSIEYRFRIKSGNTPTQVRELDEFPMMYNGKLVDLYYIYKDESSNRYTTDLPYKTVEKEKEKETGIENIDHEITPVNTRSMIIEKCKALLAEENAKIRASTILPITLADFNILEKTAKKSPEKLVEVVKQLKNKSINTVSSLNSNMSIESFKRLEYPENANNNTVVSSFKRLEYPENANNNINMIKSFKKLELMENNKIRSIPKNRTLGIVPKMMINFKKTRKNNNNSKRNKRNKTIKKDVTNTNTQNTITVKNILGENANINFNNDNSINLKNRSMTKKNKKKRTNTIKKYNRFAMPGNNWAILQQAFR